MDKANQFEAILIIVAAFVTTLLGFLIIVIKYNKSRIKHIKDKQAFQQTLLTAQIETQEQTFENISQELHDNIGQQITALNFQLENQKLKQPDTKEALDEISETLSTIARQIQSLSHSLNPNWLQQQGLIAAIVQEIERLDHISNIDFQFRCDDALALSLKIEEQIIVFRIFQELINNVLKHAQAQHILISIHAAQPFQLSVSDDGIGFDWEQMKTQSKGLGLLNMQKRAQIIGFDCVIESKKAQGTSIVLKEIIPL